MTNKSTVDLKNKVTFKEKFSYGMVNVGNIPIMTLVSSFLLIFYTNIVGLSPGACATLFLVARIIDSLNDPFIGFFIDHLPNTKWGHFRPPLVIGAILCALNFALLWFGPLLLPVFKLGIAYITYLLLGVLFPVMDISLNSMLPVMTTDVKERNSFSTIKGAVYMIGMMGLNVAAPLIIKDTNQAGGYITLIIVAVAIVIVFTVLGALGLKERVKPKQGPRYGVKDLFRILSQKPVYITFLASLISTAGFYIMNTINTFFYTYILGDLSLLSIASLISVVFLFPGMLISGKVSGSFGKKKVYIFGMVLSAMVPLIRLLAVRSVPILLATTGIAGIAQGLMMPLTYSIQADNTDYVELAIGQRAEAAIASLSSFITKFAMGIGGAIPGYILQFAGFSKDLAVQNNTVNTMIIISVIVIPAVFSVIGAFIMGIGYPITKQKLELQTAEMQKRHYQDSTI